MKRVWQGILGLAISSVWATGCLAVYDWDFQAGSGGAGTGGEAGKGGGGIGGAGAGGAGAGGAGAGGAGAGGAGAGGAGGSMNPCPGCTYGVRVGDDAEQIAFDMALGNNGSVFVVGSSKGTMALDGQVLNASVTDANQPFLLKLNQFGKVEWMTRPLDWQSVKGNGSQIAIAGNFLAWMGTIENGASGTDTFVEMRAVSGGKDTTFWRKVLGTTGDDGLRSIAISPDGTRVYLAGAISNQNLAFNNCAALVPFTSSGSDQNLVVLALDAQNGNCIWGKSWGGGHHLNGSIAVTVGSDGSPFVSGHVYSGTIANNAGIQIPQAPPQDPMGIKYRATAFILKLNQANGDLLAGRGYAYGAFIAMTADHSTKTIIASGGISANVTFLGNQIIGAPDAADGADSVVFAYDENLNEKWARNPSGPNNQFVFSVESDGKGKVYAACLSTNKLDRDTIVNCATDKLCSILLPIQTDTGAYIGNKIKTFAETQSATNMGITFMTAATPSALAVAGTWTAPVRFWDDVLLDVTGSNGDFDIAVGKVEPIP